jgi:hypothetical protein
MLLDRWFIEREGRESGLRRRSRLFARCADDVDSVVLLKREELTSGPSTGGGPSSSDEPDECLLIPAGAGGGRCLSGGGTTVGSGGFDVGGPSEWMEKGLSVRRYSWGVPSCYSACWRGQASGSSIRRCGFTESEARHSSSFPRAGRKKQGDLEKRAFWGGIPYVPTRCGFERSLDWAIARQHPTNWPRACVQTAAKRAELIGRGL